MSANTEVEQLRKEFAARVAELESALDRMQQAATTAQADNERLTRDLADARRDIDGFVEEIRGLNDQLARMGARP